MLRSAWAHTSAAVVLSATTGLQAPALRDGPRAHVPRDRGDDSGEGVRSARVAEHYLVACRCEPHGQGMSDVARTDDADPHSILRAASVTPRCCDQPRRTTSFPPGLQ